MTIASAIEKFWMFEQLGLETENQGTWSGSHGWSGSADDGVVEPAVVQDAIERYGIDADSAAPWPPPM